jgi:hypothetical protein
MLCPARKNLDRHPSYILAAYLALGDLPETHPLEGLSRAGHPARRTADVARLDAYPQACMR